MTPCTSAAPFSRWHKVHGQAVHEWGSKPWVPWWEAMQWSTWWNPRIPLPWDPPTEIERAAADFFAARALPSPDPRFTRVIER